MDEIKRILATFQKKTIGLSELEGIMKPFFDTYEEFSKLVLLFEEAGILVMMKSKGRTTRKPALAFQYRIQKSLLVSNFHKELQQYRSILHPSINLDEYYQKDPSVWEKDLPFIKKLDQYLKRNAFPTEHVPAPERSYELVGDEKWIVEKGGKELLERIGLFDQLHIIPVSEPLMFAINPIRLNDKTQYHLIVENKTTYQGLLPALVETAFSTLIYGSGKAVIKSIEQFSMQYPITANHHFFYFGDIDKEGISIWYSLTKRKMAILALPFYQACLQKEAATGKEYQLERREAQDEFLTFFTTEEQNQISSISENGKYYPQETLKTKELQQIWRDSNWTSLI